MLIKRATQISDVDGELNPYGLKFQSEQQNIKMEVLKNLPVYSKVDPQLNRLRVLPPQEIQESYPDMQRDKRSFYAKIGCSHLAPLNQQFKAVTGVIHMKLRFAYEGSTRIISQIDWEMFEMHPEMDSEFWGFQCQWQDRKDDLEDNMIQKAFGRKIQNFMN